MSGSDASGDAIGFEMLVSIPVKPESLHLAIEILDSEMARVRSEPDCHDFRVYVEEPSTIWLYEAYTSEAYHHQVHEQFPEVQSVMTRLPEHIAAPWTIHKVQRLLTR